MQACPTALKGEWVRGVRLPGITASTCPPGLPPHPPPTSEEEPVHLVESAVCAKTHILWGGDAVISLASDESLTPWRLHWVTTHECS